MKTIKDIIKTPRDYRSTREYVSTKWIGGRHSVNISKIKYGDVFRYLYTYDMNGKRVESPMFSTMRKMLDHQKKTLKVVMGVTTVEG